MGYFEILLECSVALGGFAAVHAVLRGSTGPRGSYRAWGTVAFAFTAALMSLVPLVIANAGALDAEGWSWASVIAIALCAACVSSNIHIDRRLSRAGHPAQTPTMLRVAQTVPFLSIALLVANLVGAAGPVGPFLYGIAVALIFVNGIQGIGVSFWLAMEEAIERERE